MKKRLRKKKRVGEFREWGCVLEFRLGPDADLSAFLDMFVEQVEKIGCYCGGGGSGSSLSMVVELGRDVAAAAARLAELIQWGQTCPMVELVSSSEIIDLWNPPSPNSDAGSLI